MKSHHIRKNIFGVLLERDFINLLGSEKNFESWKNPFRPCGLAYAENKKHNKQPGT